MSKQDMSRRHILFIFSILALIYPTYELVQSSNWRVLFVIAFLVVLSIRGMHGSKFLQK